MNDTTQQIVPKITLYDIFDHAVAQTIIVALLLLEGSTYNTIGLSIAWILAVMQFCTASLDDEAKQKIVDTYTTKQRCYPGVSLFVIIAIAVTYVLAAQGHFITAIVYALSSFVSCYTQYSVKQLMQAMSDMASQQPSERGTSPVRSSTLAEEKRQARRAQHKEITQRVNDRNYS